MQDRGPKMDHDTHISGVEMYLEKLTDSQRHWVAELRTRIVNEEVAEANTDYLKSGGDGLFVKFLIARQWDIDKAHTMMMVRSCARLRASSSRALDGPSLFIRKHYDGE